MGVRAGDLAQERQKFLPAVPRLSVAVTSLVAISRVADKVDVLWRT